MEVLLLSFCFISLTLSSVFVVFELVRDQRRQKLESLYKSQGNRVPSNGKLPRNTEGRPTERHQTRPSSISLEDNHLGAIPSILLKKVKISQLASAHRESSKENTSFQLKSISSRKEKASKKSKILAMLNRQLKALGYISPNQQLGFVNRVLNSERIKIEDINANDVRQLFKVIRRYTDSDPTTKSSPLPQNNIRAASAL